VAASGWMWYLFIHHNKEETPYAKRLPTKTVAQRYTIETLKARGESNRTIAKTIAVSFSNRRS
jgi:hypothetical protein